MYVSFVIEGFREELYWNTCVVCVCKQERKKENMCTKDGGAGRKRGRDSVCEKKNNIAYEIK